MITRATLSHLLPVVPLLLLTWLAATWRRDTSLIDRVWGLGFVLVAWSTAAATWRARGTVDLLLVGLVTIWGLRLSLHLTVRNWGHGEDRRYAAMRAQHPDTWWWRSLVTVFVLQGVLMAIIALPILAAVPVPGRGWLRIVSAVVAAIGIGYEAVADWQLLRFRRDPASKGRVLDRGLWRWSRHPNYFGEILVWWGFGGMAVAAGAWWALASPLLITVLLLRVSGVPLLEADLVARRPDYARYLATTPAVVPSRRRSPGAIPGGESRG